MTHNLTTTNEGGGVVGLCTCGWEQWKPTKPALDKAHHKHKPRPAKED